MQLRWTREAAADLERIADYLFQHVPDRAAELVRAAYDAPALLLHDDVIFVVRILHGAQPWP